MKGRPGTVIAGCFAMSAFAVSIIAGLAVGNETASILTRAVGAMLICYPVGLVVGGVCERVVQSHLEVMLAAAEDTPASEPASPDLTESEDVIVV